MAKRGKKNGRDLGPLGTLLDFAECITMGYVENKIREQNRDKKNKIDPYAAAGAAFGMGKLKNTEDIIKLGGMLGAMGAFDPDDDWRENCLLCLSSSYNQASNHSTIFSFLSNMAYTDP